MLCAHGLSGQRLNDVVRVTTLARLTYASSAWVGFLNAAHKDRINAVIRKLIRHEYLPPDQPMFEQLSNTADCRLFSSILSNNNHVLHKFLPSIKVTGYTLCLRAHNRQLPLVNSFDMQGFFARMLFA